MVSHTDDSDRGLALALVFGPDSASAAAGRTALWLATLVAGLFVLTAATGFGIGVDAALIALALAAGPALGAWVAGRRAGLLFTGLVVSAPLAGVAGAYLVGALLRMTPAITEPQLRTLALSAAGYLLVGTAVAFALGRAVGFVVRAR